MGIKNLHKFLRKHCSHIYNNDVPLSNYRGKRIAVDVNLYLYHYKKSCKHRWLQGFQNFINTLHKNGIECVFIFDTKSPPEKANTKTERKSRKKNVETKIQHIEEDMRKYERTGEISEFLCQIIEKRQTQRLLPVFSDQMNMDRDAVQRELNNLNNQLVNVTYADVDLCKKLLTDLCVPFFDSENEAETLCAQLACNQLVDAVLSDDTDVLVYGTPLFLTKLNMRTETVEEICFQDILDSLEMTRDQFRDLCIMCGTDYNRNIPRVANEKAYKLMKKYGSLEEIENNGLNVDILNYKRVREIFHVPSEMNECFSHMFDKK